MATTIGILSIGDMGLGIAKLLKAFNYSVVTNVSDRSAATQERAKSADIETLPTDSDLVARSDYILSIVPPRDALATAKRIVAALSGSSKRTKTNPLYFLDLNAISPRSATEIASLFSSSAPDIRLIDGGIIGGPPSQSQDGSWKPPSIVVSGPHKLADAQPSGAHLAEILGVKHIGPTIGPASGLKMCFASMTKGFTAIAIQSFTTAYRLGVLEALQAELEGREHGARAARGLVSMPTKAYRWVGEMEEIADTFHQEGGFGRDVFHGAAETYKLVAEDTELGKEVQWKRVRGKDPVDVVRLVSEGVDRVEKKGK